MLMRNTLFVALITMILLCNMVLANSAFEIKGNVPKSIEVTAPDNPNKWTFGLMDNEYRVGNIHITTNSDSWAISLSANPDRMTSGTYSILNPVYAKSLFNRQYITNNYVIELSSSPKELLKCSGDSEGENKNMDLPLNISQFVVIGDVPAQNYQTVITVTGMAS